MIGFVLAIAALGWLVWPALHIPSEAAVDRLRAATPRESALMLQRRQANPALHLQHRFVPLDAISNHLQRAVVLAEDQKFWMHDGIDWGETRAAVQSAFQSGRLGRGASTLTQQLAKNLFLSEERSVRRKVAEWRLASRLDDRLAKKRLLELYLNFAEWGEGIFGAEAAARAHFGKSASQLDPAEAAILTAMLPSPLTRNPRQPNDNLRRRARHVAHLMADVGISSRRHLDSRLDKLLGARAPRKQASN